VIKAAWACYGAPGWMAAIIVRLLLVCVALAMLGITVSRNDHTINPRFGRASDFSIPVTHPEQQKLSR